MDYSKNNIIKLCDDVNKALDSYNVSAAIRRLQEASRAAGCHAISDKITSISETYRYMTHYMLQGVPDETRMDVYSSILSELRRLGTKIRREVMTADSNSPYFESLRLLRMRPQKFDEVFDRYCSLHDKITLSEFTDSSNPDILKDKVAMEECASNLFSNAWTSLDDKNMAKKIVELASDSEFQDSIAILLVNAFNLSLIDYYDGSKVTALIDIYEGDTTDALKARALAGIIFALMIHPEEVSADKSVKLRLEMWQDSLLEFSRLKHFTREMIRTRDTERISKKMMDEVIPEIMKLKPEITEQMRKISDDSESRSFEDNPEWEEILEKSGLGKKMRELADLQSEGADMLMPAFSGLKQFPFFNSVSNWFMPFDTSHSILEGRDSERAIMERMEPMSSNLCDVDKYSLALALQRMPESQRNMMVNQLDAQLSQMTEEMKATLSAATDNAFNVEITKTLRGFYRFFKLFRKKDYFYDPFGKPFDFMSLPIIGNMLDDREIISLASEFYFKRGYYREALPMFESIVDGEGDSETEASIWEKIGFCRQQLGDSAGALDAYNKSELLKEPSEWLLRKLAYLNKESGDFKKASEYYSRLLDSDPDNVSKMLNAGFCALNLGNPAEALGYYYHANYLQPDSDKILRAIAWCEFLNKNFDKSISYYDKVLSISPTPADYLNRGHVLLVKGDYKDALNSYQLAAGNDFQAFEKTFRIDVPILESTGLDHRIAMIMLDCLRDARK